MDGSFCLRNKANIRLQKRPYFHLSRVTSRKQNSKLNEHLKKILHYKTLTKQQQKIREAIEYRFKKSNIKDYEYRESVFFNNKIMNDSNSSQQEAYTNIKNKKYINLRQYHKNELFQDMIKNSSHSNTPINKKQKSISSFSKHLKTESHQNYNSDEKYKLQTNLHIITPRIQINPQSSLLTPQSKLPNLKNINSNQKKRKQLSNEKSKLMIEILKINSQRTINFGRPQYLKNNQQTQHYPSITKKYKQQKYKV